MIPRLAWLAITTLILSTAAGCGPSFGTVEGMVTIDGKPANNGTVIFSGARNLHAAGVIRPDGSYVAQKVPVGDVKVVIHQMVMLAGGPDRSGPLNGLENPDATASQLVPIPKKYQNIETSNLTCTVTGGTNRFDIELLSQ
jgi:hypothetical protein